MSLCDVPVLSTVCDVVGNTASSLVTAPFEWLAQAIGSTAALIFEGVWVVFDQTTLVDVTSPDYVAVYNILFGVGVFFMFGFFLLQLITGLVRRDVGALSRAATGLAKAVLGSFLVITLTAFLLEIVDQLCIGIIQATGNTIDGMGLKIGALIAGLGGLTVSAPGVGAIVMIFFGALAIAAAAIVWFSLLIRKSLLLVAIVLAPIALSGSSWDMTRTWFGKWAQFVIALIVSKLVITVIFLVAITQVNSPLSFDLAALTDPIAGIVLMALAGFGPYLTYKFVAFLGFDLYQTMSTEQEAKQALNRPLPVPSKPQGSPPSSILKGNSDDSGGGAPPASPAPTGTEAGTAEAGAGATEGGVAAGGGAGAAGPVGAVVLAAEVVKETAEAGPAMGAEVSGVADQQLGAAQEPGSPTSGNSAGPPPSPEVPPAPPGPPPTTPPNPPAPSPEP